MSGLCLITCRKKIDQQYFNQGLVKGIIILASALRWIHNIPPKANKVSLLYKFIIIILQSCKLHSKIIPIKTSLESKIIFKYIKWMDSSLIYYLALTPSICSIHLNWNAHLWFKIFFCMNVRRIKLSAWTISIIKLI